MKNKLYLAVAIMVAAGTFSGCVPLIVGAAGAVVADKVVEQKEGGDGLF